MKRHPFSQLLKLSLPLFCLLIFGAGKTVDADETAPPVATAPDSSAAAAGADAGALVTASGAAVTLPSAEEVQKVMDYFLQGKDQGPILVRLTPCLKVEANQCNQVAEGKVKVGTRVTAHMVFLVPVGGAYSDLSLQWAYKGAVRTTRDLQIKGATAGSMRYRMTSSESLSKAGAWEARVLRGDKELAKFSIEAE